MPLVLKCYRLTNDQKQDQQFKGWNVKHVLVVFEVTLYIFWAITKAHICFSSDKQAPQQPNISGRQIRNQLQDIQLFYHFNISARSILTKAFAK